MSEENEKAVAILDKQQWIHPCSTSVQLSPVCLGDLKNVYHNIVPHKYHDSWHYCLTPKITCRLTQFAWVAIFSHTLNPKCYKTGKQACFLKTPCSPQCLYFKALCACCYIWPINLSQPLAARSYSHLVKYRRVIPPLSVHFLSKIYTKSQKMPKQLLDFWYYDKVQELSLCLLL